MSSIRIVLIALVLALLAAGGLVAGGTETCFGQGEKIDGNNKICYYDCPSGGAAITVKSYQLCPLSIKR